MTHRKPLLTAALLATAIGLGACQPKAAAPVASKVAEDGEAFVARINEELSELSADAEAASWVYENFITADTARIDARYQETLARFRSEALATSARYDIESLPSAAARALKLLRLDSPEPAPNDAAKRREVTELSAELAGQYGAGKYCPDEDRCYALGELEAVLAKSRDYDETLEAWVGWRRISPPMRKAYQRFVELTNEGAKELGFDNVGDLWKSGYDMPADDFDTEATRLWGQVEPLYEELHCYVRRKLGDHYGADKVAQDQPIPAHLLGNMWAQQWSEIYDLVTPYPGVADVNVNSALQAQGWTAEKMVRTAEDFFVSLGLPELPETFYERSLFTKPADRDVVCHASAWPLEGGRDPRIKMCIEPTSEMLSTIYHELGHIYYYLAYPDQPVLFRQGAHDGFHEGIGDTIVLSLTPQFLQQLGLVDELAEGNQALINTQMRMALDKIAFLPFGKLIDEWRWRVFSGEIGPDEYNAGWWELREKYQGIASAVPRSEADFDPGAKYHVPNNTPYTRYFLAHIMQFQFQRALCDAAGFDGPLHECSIYGSKEAGAKLEAMLAAGASEPWQDTLFKLTGTREMDASAIQDYFLPLKVWLEQQNEGQACGW